MQDFIDRMLCWIADVWFDLWSDDPPDDNSRGPPAIP